MNVLLSGLTIAFVGLLGRRFAGDSVGLTAAAFAAVYPNLVFYSFSLWPASVYLPLLLGALLLLSARRLGVVSLVAAGALMGAAALTKEVGTILPAIGGLWILGRSGFRSRRAWGGALLLGAAFAAVVLPWSFRQNRESDSFALITQTRWMNLYLGNVPQENLPKHRHGLPPYAAFYALGKDLAGREAAARPLVIRAVRERMPWWPLEKTVEMIPRVLSPNSLPVMRLLLRPGPGPKVRSAYVTRVDGTRAERLRDALAYVTVAGRAIALLAGSAGLALSWGRRLSWLLALCLALHLLPVIVTFGMSRFRLPIMPVLLIGAAWFAREGIAAWKTGGSGRRAAAVAAVAVPALILGTRWWTVASPHCG